MKGQVVMWHTSGYGFVEAEDGRRIYVHHTAFGGGDLEVGLRVCFSVAPDLRNPGKLMAQWLVKDGDPLPGSAGFYANQGAGAAFQPGMVMEWHEERGFGFVELLDLRKVYVHHTAFGGGSLKIGEHCEVVVVPDQVNPGRWSAGALRGQAVVPRYTSGEEGAQTSGDSQQHGGGHSDAGGYELATVVEWREDRGFGFAELADSRRVYVHHSSFGGGSLIVGGIIELIVKPDLVNPGKWSAASVVRGPAVEPRPPSAEEPAAKRLRA